MELDLLKAQDERLSVEKRSTLLKKVQLKRRGAFGSIFLFFL